MKLIEMNVNEADGVYLSRQGLGREGSSPRTSKLARIDVIAHDLHDQRVLVVGGSGEMGLAVARMAAESGAEVIISGRSRTKLEEIEKVSQNDSDAFATRAADFSVAEEAESLMRNLAPLDHIVVTTSGGGPAGSVPDTPPEMAQVAFARFWVSYHALHYARDNVRPDGSVNLLSGSSSRRPMAGFGVWGTLHGSIEALARNAVLELAPIRINVVSPGGIGMRPDRQLAHHAGKPSDVASMMLAVMTNPAVTGAVVDVDGGERLGTWSGR